MESISIVRGARYKGFVEYGVQSPPSMLRVRDLARHCGLSDWQNMEVTQPINESVG